MAQLQLSIAFLAAVKQQDYRRALELSHEILAVDPTNETVMQYQPILADMIEPDQEEEDDEEDAEESEEGEELEAEAAEPWALPDSEILAALDEQPVDVEPAMNGHAHLNGA